MTVSPDGRQVLTSGYDGSARLWDLATGKEIRKFVGHDDFIISLGFSPDGTQVLTRGGTWARLWDVASGQEIHEIPGLLFAFSPDSKHLFTTGEAASNRGSVTGQPDSPERKLVAPLLWRTGREKEFHALQGHTDAVTFVVFSPDGNLVLTGSADGTARIWHTASSQEMGRLLAFADGTWAAATSDNYYTASKGALKGVAFRVGNHVFPFDQFDLKFNRPDNVLKSIGLASEELIAVYRHAYQKRLKRMNFTEKMLGDDFHLPTIKLLTQWPLATRAEVGQAQASGRVMTSTSSTASMFTSTAFRPAAPPALTCAIKKTGNWEQSIDIELSRGPKPESSCLPLTTKALSRSRNRLISIATPPLPCRTFTSWWSASRRTRIRPIA